MHQPLSNRTVWGSLVALTVFCAFSALVGAALAVAFNGAGVPLEHLAHSSFSSYVVPGLVLGVVVGGTQLAAAVTLLTKRRSSLLLSAVAGFGMLIWIYAELAIIRQYSWLQTAFFMFGVLELILVLALLGIVPTLVYPLRRPTRRTPLHRLSTARDVEGDSGTRPDPSLVRVKCAARTGMGFQK